MTCSEILDEAALYHSGELAAARREAFDTHLGSCAACAAEIGRQIALDRRLAHALGPETHDARAVTAAVRARIAAERGRRLGLIAAAAVLVISAGSLVMWQTSVPAEFRGAARDHRVEVTGHLPRRWRVAPADIQALAARLGVPDPAALNLAPAGYHLEMAKMCGLGGHPVLHLVYAGQGRDGQGRDGQNREISVYLWRGKAVTAAGITSEDGDIRMAAFQAGGAAGIVVTPGTASECLDLAGRAAHSLL